jgi:3'-phosphoadenosine 5'-phosphosulfate sulfotransferase (PAPS reductase)/FAD synthetase
MSAYKMDHPFVVSFSGGRTSGFMLHQILQANGGIPDGSHVCFANTGKEHEATLQFVQEIADTWQVKIAWIERKFDTERGFDVTNFQTAARNGEPFAGLIDKKMFLPNPVMRFCTSELKVVPIAKYVKEQGVTDATMLVGLRADEPRRVHRVQGDVRQGFDYDCPIARAGHTLTDVRAFWNAQPFDLRLPNDDRAFGNCDLCFLKGKGVIERVLRHEPERATWWADQEAKVGARFRKDQPTYASILHQINIQPELFGATSDEDNEIIPCTCTD